MGRKNYSGFYNDGKPTEHVKGAGKQLIVLDLLQHYDLLPSTILREHIRDTGSDSYGEKLLTKLSKGHYIRLPDVLRAQKPKPRGNTYFYQLDNRGKALLDEKGLWLGRERQSDPHTHKILRCLVQYAFDHPSEGIRFIDEDAILADDRCPPATRAKANPSYFKVGSHEVQPDGPIFGYERDNVFMFFHGFEADNGNEDIEDTASNRKYNKTTLEKKLRHYTAYLDRELHDTLYGIGNVYIPFVFAPGFESRMRSAIALLKRKYPSHQLRFLFTTYVPDLVNATWHTTTGTFNIIEKLKGGETNGPKALADQGANKRQGAD